MALQLTLMTLDVDPNAKPITKVFYKEELTLGRLPSNDLVLNRPEVSGIHARLRVEKDEFGEITKLYITDLGSSNGTMIEKTPLRPRVEVAMMTNERIFIGNFVIKPTPIIQDDYDTNQTMTNLERPEKAEKIEKQSGLEDALKDYSHKDSSKSASLKRELFIDDEDEFEDVDSYSFSAPLNSNNASVSGHASASPVSSLIFSDGGLANESFKTIKAEETKEVKQPSKRVKESFSIKVNVSGDDITTANIVAKAFTTITGKIENKNIGLSGVKVTSKTLGTVETDSEGYFSFKKVLEGTDYELQFSKDKFLFDPKWMKGVSSTKPINIDIEAIKLCTISGVVSHNGSPLSGVEVDGGELGTVTTGADGVYTFENVPEGKEYGLTLSKEGFAFHD